MEVLHSGYLVPLHQLPLVSQEPVEFLSYSSGYVKAQALQAEVDKMLEKDALYISRSSGYKALQSLNPSSEGGRRPVVDLLALNHCVTFIPLRMEMVALVLGSTRKGEVMFSIKLKDVYLEIPIHPDFHPYLWIALSGRVYQFRALCFGLHSSPDLHQGVLSGVRVGSKAEDSPSPISRRLVDHCRLGPSSVKTLGAPSQSLQRPGQKSDFKLISKAQYLRMLIRHHLGESLPNRLLDCQVLECGGHLSLSSLSLKMW